ncbi:MAG: hypothetical protein ACEQSX_07145 [Baekduiaceae bacterium]
MEANPASGAMDKFFIKYQGAIDDNAGEPEKAKHHFLTDAIDELLQNIIVLA